MVKHNDVYCVNQTNNESVQYRQNGSQVLFQSVWKVKNVIYQMNNSVQNWENNNKLIIDSIGESRITVFNDCDYNYDVDLDATQQEAGKFSIKKLNDEDILSVKFQAECENLTENLNRIQREHSNGKYGNNFSDADADNNNHNNYYDSYGVVCDKSNTNNCLSLPPELRANNNMPNDGGSKSVLLHSSEDLDCI